MSEVKRYDMRVSFGGVESYESPCGEYVDYEDYAALEDKCVALAAENAWMKAGILQASEDMEAHHDDHGLFSYDADGEQMDALLRLCDAHDSIASLENTKTQATDAFLAEVRAQGVEMFGQYHNFSEKLFIQKEAQKFAAQLRKGGEQK